MPLNIPVPSPMCQSTPPTAFGNSPETDTPLAPAPSRAPVLTPLLIPAPRFCISLPLSSPHTTPKFLALRTTLTRVDIPMHAQRLFPASPSALGATKPLFPDPTSITLPSTPLAQVGEPGYFALLSTSAMLMRSQSSLLRWYPIQRRHWILHLRGHFPQVAVRGLQWCLHPSTWICPQESINRIDANDLLSGSHSMNSVFSNTECLT